MPSRKVVRPDDKRLSVNKPPRTTPEPPKSRYIQLMEGTLTVEDLDDEEIMAGKCKDVHGQFRGRPPKVFPRALHDALRREYQKRMQERLSEQADLAVATLLDVMNNRRTAAPARVRAAEIMLERVMGKVPDKIQQTLELKPFEENLGDLLVDLPEEVADLGKKRQEKSA